MSQQVIPGIAEPLPSETEFGQAMLELRDQLGFARGLKVAHWVKEGEESRRPPERKVA